MAATEGKIAPSAAVEVQVRSLHWAPHVPTWALAGAALLLLLAVLASVRFAAAAAPGPTRRRRLGAAAARALGSGALCLALAGPTLQTRRGRPEPRSVAVVFDDSASMNRPAADGNSGAAAAEAVGATLAASLAPAAVTTWNLRGPCAGAGCTAPTGGDSPLLEALERAAANRSTVLAALVLVSDGLDTALDLGVEPGPNGAPRAPTDEERRRLQALQVPVSTVATGSRGAFDLRVARVGLDPVVFVKTTVELDCVVVTRGRVPGPVEVQLWQGATLLERRTLKAPPGPAELHARFAIRAERVEEAVYTCRVQAQPGERNLENNARSAVLRPVRDKVRVLHVAGRPSLDERFLRQALQDDRNVEVVSFFILRTPHSDGSVPERELSLIPFPVGRLFTEELRNFDAVVLQNFDFRPYAMAQYLGNLRRAVREQGLGLVLLGGEEGFAEGGYGGTPLEDVLPHVLSPTIAAAPPAPPACGAPRLTDAGRHHPVLALTPLEAERAAYVRALPALGGFNALGSLQPAAQVLLEAQFADAGGGRWPLLSARDVGRGRTLAVATDDLWRWAYAPRGPEAAPQAYRQLWRNAWRWLTHDPQLGRLRMTLARTEATAGAAGAILQGEVRALDAAWRPAVGAPLRVAAVPHPDASTEQAVGAATATARRLDAPAPLALRADADGRASFRLGPLAAGVWRVCAARDGAGDAKRASVAPPDDAVGPPPDGDDGPAGARDDCTAVVVHPGPEAALDADGDAWLAALAEATGGAHRRADQVARVGLGAPTAPPPPLRVTGQDLQSLSGHPALLAAILLGFGAAAYLGRRAGGR